MSADYDRRDTRVSHFQSFSRSRTLSIRPNKQTRFGDKSFEIAEEEPPAPYVKKGDHVDLSREPSYTKFKIP